MLTNLEWLNPGKTFPPLCEKPRLDQYLENERLFMTEHAKVWKDDFRRLAGKYRKKNFDVETVLNYHQLLSKKTADFVCGDPPILETEGDTDKLVRLLDGQRFAPKLYESVIDISRFGNGVFKFRGKGISAVSPLGWFPVVDEADLKDITHHVIAYPCGFNDKGIPDKLYAEIHTPGFIEQRWHEYDAEKRTVGRLSEGPTKKATGLSGFAVQVLTNITHSGSVYGIDDYLIVNSLIKKIMWRLHCADTILDKHSEPSVSGPASALQKDEQTGLWYVPLGNYFKRASSDDPDLRYVTWDGNLESNFKELEFLVNQLYILTEMGQAFADASGGDSSGTALKLRMVSPRIKAARIANLNAGTVKQIIAELARVNSINIAYDTLTVKWKDGLPQDEKEETERLVTATGGKPVMSQYAALKARGLSDKDVEAELEQMSKERISGSPVQLGVIDPFDELNPEDGEA